MNMIRTRAVQNILLTGGCGFIGSNLAPVLIRRGYRVRILDNMSRGLVSYLSGQNVEIIEGDIGNPVYVARALKDIDSVIHLAAYGSVIESIRDPITNFNANSYGTLVLLQCCAAAGIKRFLFSSTGGAIMGNTPPPVDECSLPRPISPYGASKLCCEGYISAFSHIADMRSVIFRFANIYGPNSAHKTGAVTNFIKSLMLGKPIQIYGDGSSGRDFLHVFDLCQGIVKALEAENIEPLQILHLASGRETSILELARNLMDIAKLNNHPINFLPTRKGEVSHNFASNSLAEQLLDFSPQISITDGLKQTWNWFLIQNKSFIENEATDS